MLGVRKFQKEEYKMKGKTKEIMHVNKLIVEDRNNSIDYESKLKNKMVGSVLLKDIYKRFPFEDILNTITQEMTFNEFEAVVFYMFMKKVVICWG